MRKNTSSRFGALTLLAGVAACGDGVTGPQANGQAPVSIAFSASALPAGASGFAASRADAAAENTLVIAGSNGVLTITDLRLVVAEFELDRVVDDCGGLPTDSVAENDDDDCEKFEAGPSFVDVPLAGGTAVAVTQQVPADRYDELEFEVEDLDDDEEDSAEAALIAALRTQIRAEFPEWPREASMLVEGTFAPTDAEPIPFRAFFEAEIEVELELSPPLDLTRAAPATVTVTIDPGAWFARPDGTVLDLSQLDFARTGRVLEFEVEMEQGFRTVEF